MRRKTSIWIRTLAMFLCLSLMTESVPMTAAASEPKTVRMQAAEEIPSDENPVIEEEPDEEAADSPAMQDGEEDTYSLVLDNDEGILNSSGPESVKAGEQVTVDVTIADGFYFYEAIYNGADGPVQAEEITENTYKLTFEMPAQDVLLFIKSEPYRKVILVQSEHGTISADKTEGKDGELVHLTADPAPGYVLKSWYMTVTDENGTSEIPVSDDNTFQIRWGDMTVTGIFEPDETDYAIMIDQQVDNGTISTANGQDTARSGDSVILNVHPDPGYQLDSLAVTDTDGREVVWDGPGGNNADEYTFKMPASAVEVTASFAAAFYEIQVGESEGLRYSDIFVNGVKGQQAKVGDEIRIVPSLKTGYEITGVTWQVNDGEEVSADSADDGYRFTLNTPGDVIVRFSMERIKYELLSEYDHEKGEITLLVEGEERNWAYYGERIIVKAEPVKGYTLSRVVTRMSEDGEHWILDNNTIDISEDNQAEITMPHYPIKVCAEFDLALNDISIVSAEGIHKSTVYVNDTEARKARVGDEINVKLLPEMEYRITGVTWQVDDGEETEVPAPDNDDNYREYKFKLEAPGDVTIHVYTEKIKFDILSDYDNSKGRLSFLVDGQETDKAYNGDRVTVDVEPAEGYALSRLYFTAFIDDQEESYRAEIEKDNEGKYTFIMEPVVVKVYAVFALETRLEVKLNWEDGGRNYKHDDVTVQLQKRGGQDGQQWTVEEELILNSANVWTQSVAVQGEAADFRFIELDRDGGQILPRGNRPAEAEFGLQSNRASYVAEYSAVYAAADTTTTITNTLKKQNLSVSAKWGGDVTDKPARIQAQLQIYNNAALRWETTGQRKTLTNDNSWQEQYTDIPVLKDTDGGTVYRIRQLNGRSGSNIIYDPNDADRQDGSEAVFSVTRENSVEVYVTYRSAVYAIGNDGSTEVTYSDPLVKKTFSVRKEWKEDVENEADTSPESIRAQLQKQPGAGLPWEEVQTLEVKGGSWRASFDPVEETAENRDWNWRVVELDGESAPIEQDGTLRMEIEDAENGAVGGITKNTYAVTYDMDYSGNDAGCTVIANTLTGSKKEWIFTVRKVWEDNVFDYGDTVIKVALKKKEKGSEEWTIVETIELKESGEWKGTFSPAYSLEGCTVMVSELDENGLLEDGDTGDFKVKKDGESVTASYEVNVDRDPQNEDSGWIITNKLKQKTFAVQKIWEDDEPWDHADLVVKTELQKKAAGSEDWTTIETLELTEGKKWTGRFKPVFFASGDEFRVRERDGKDNLLTESGEDGYFEVDNLYPNSWQPTWHTYEVDYDFDEEDNEFTVVNKLKQTLVISADLQWLNDGSYSVNAYKIYHEKPVTAVLRVWDEDQGIWVEKEEIQLTKENNWKGTFAENGIKTGDKWEVRERDQDGNLVEGDGILAPFPVIQNEVERQEDYAVKYDVFEFDPLNPIVIIKNKGKTDRVECRIKIVWEDGEEGVTHKPLTVKVGKSFGGTGVPLGEEEIGKLEMNGDNSWEGSLYSDNNEIQRIYCQFFNDEGHLITILDELNDENDPVSQMAGKFTCYKNEEPFTYDYKLTSKTIADQDDEFFTETTLTLTKVDLGMRTSSVKIEWQQEPPAEYKPESLTAQLLHLEYVGEEQEWVAKAEAELNNNNNWSHTFDPLPDDGDEKNYLVDLLDENGNRLYVNKGIVKPDEKPDAPDPYLTGFAIMQCRIRKENGTENIVEYAVNAPESENNLTTIYCSIYARYFSVRSIRVEEPALEFANNDTPVHSTYILQHQSQDGEWEKVGKTEPTQLEDRKFFEIEGVWTDDNYRVREIDEQENTVEENGTIVLSARKDDTPLNLQYRVNYGKYGEYQAGEFPVTKTLMGLVFPTEIKWEGGEAQTPVQVIVQSGQAGADNWSEVQDSTAELSTQNHWSAQAGPVAYEAGRAYRVRAKVDGQAVEDGDELEIDGELYKFSYKSEDDGRTVITAEHIIKKTYSVVLEWDVGSLGIDAQKDPSFVRLLPQHLENGQWKEGKVFALSYDDPDKGPGWRSSFDIQDEAGNYRVVELDAEDYEIKEGEVHSFYVNENGQEVLEPFQVSYQFQADEENEDHAGTLTIKNTYAPEKTSVKVSVAGWDDSGNEDGLQPDSVKVKLLADDQDTQKTLDLNRENNFQGSFDDLDNFKAENQKIQYTVQIQQDNVITGEDGKLTYSYEIAGDAGNGYTVTLKHTPQTVTYSASVTWEDNNDQDGKRPLSVDLVLKKEGDAGQGNDDPPAINLAGQGNQWNGQFPAQPAVRDGREVNYTIEQNTPQGYQYAVQKNNNSFDVTYTHDPEQVTLSGSVTWIGDEDNPGDRPANVEIRLYAGGQQRQTVQADGPLYNFAFNNLDKYANKALINYSIRQANVNKYQTAVTNMGTVYTITNIHNPDNNNENNNNEDEENNENEGNHNGNNGGHGGHGPGGGGGGGGFGGLIPAVAGGIGGIIVVGGTIAVIEELNKKVDVSGKVIWNHGDNPEGNRPEACTVQLLADGEIVKNQYKDLTVQENPDWKFTFSNVPKYYNKNTLTKTKYTVIAGAVRDYTASFMGMTVTYTYTPGKTQAAVTVVWKDGEDQDGIRPDSVDIRLTNESSINRTMTLPRNGEWSGTFDDLDDTQTYKADIVRTKVINGSDSKGTYAVTITGDQSLGFFIWLTHTPTLPGVSGKIVWEDDDNQEKKRPKEVTVTLMARLSNGDVVDMTTATDDEGKKIPNMKKTVKASEDWKVSFIFDKKPVASDGGAITWFLKQEPVDGYITTVNGMTVLNTLKTAAVTSFSGTIAWEDNDNAAGDRPESVRLRLLADGTVVDNQIRTVTAGQDQAWNWTFEELPQFNKDGSEIIYSVTEDAVPDYTTSYAAGAGNSASVTITNTYAPETMDLTIRKIWEDDSDAAGARPENVTVHLFANGDEINADGTPAGGASGETNGITIPGGTGDTWSLVLKDLRRYRAGGEIDYSVTEEPVEEYQSAIDGLDITNTYAPTTQDIEASVIWQDNDDAEGQRPESVTIRLYADDTELEDRAVTLTAQNADENGNWTYAFTGLPRTREDEEGNPVPVVYEISEDPVTDYNESVNGFNVINTFSRQTRKFTGTVTWDDADDQDGIRPDKVLVRLLADGEEVEGKTEEISALQDWKWNFTKLPKYEKGREISYSVTEEQTAVLTGTDGPGTYAFEMVTETADPESGTTGGRFLKNTHTPETVTIAGEKTWEDNDDAEDARPGNITIRLLADGTELTDKAAVVSADEEGQWKWSFPGLPRYAGGKEIAYSIHEDPVPDYTAEVDGYDVTNTYTPGRTQVDVVLKWQDDSNRDGIRPQTVTIQLYEGNTPVTGRTLTLSEADNWQGSFTDLPITRGGDRIGYSVSPEVTDVLSGNPGPGTYGVSMVNASLTSEGETGNYYRITFTHEPETIDVSGTKTWVDDDNYDNTRPEGINIRLLADGAAVGLQKKVTAQDEWKWSFTGLPKYRDGKVITYSIYEDAVKNYTTVIDGMNAVNTISYEPEFKTYALLLTGLIGVNIYMDLPGDPEKYKDSYMTFAVKGKKEEERADFNKDFKDTKKLYYGFTGHINSIQMAEPITCTFHYQGEDGDKTITAVVKASNYIERAAKIHADQPDVVALLNALGNYGHYVQPFLSEARNWKIGEDYQEMPGTSEITNDMIINVSGEAKAYALSTTKDVNSKVGLSYSLNMESGTLIYIYIKPEQGKTVTATLDGKETAADPLDGGYYLVTVPGASAHELDVRHKINVTTGEESFDINVCALSYVNTILNPPKGYYSLKARTAVTALFNYFKAAVAFMKNNH